MQAAVRPVVQRAAVAAVLLWTAAALIHAASGRWSVVLLIAPAVFALGDLLAARRKARLTALVDATLPQLVSNDAAGPPFSAAQATVMERRDRLLGVLPPTLHALRVLQSADGRFYRVRAVVGRDDADAIDWRVERLPDGAPPPAPVGRPA